MQTGQPGYGARVWRSFVAGLAGWLAGFIASAPAMLVVGWRDSEHELRTFFALTGPGLLTWAGWTLLLAIAAWLLAVLPSALLISPKLLLRHRRAVLAMIGLLTLVIVVLKMRVFQDYAASHMVLRFTLYLPYGLFAIVFALITAWWYIRSIQAPRSVNENERLQ